MKKVMLIILILVLAHTYLTAQAVPAIAPLKVGNKWIYHSNEVFSSYTYQYAVSESIKVINEIPFHIIMQGRNLEYKTYMALTVNQFFVMYHEGLTDSLYSYFKLDPQKGDKWEQQWRNGIILYNSIVDTFTANVFGYSSLIYQIDRTTVIDGDSTFYWGSREYWTEEFGMLNGIYEQAEDILIGCVIDGIVYGDTTTVGIDDEEELPTEFVLYQNYPNPFNPITKIKYSIPQSGNIQIKAYNILGSELATLVNEYKQAGTYEVEFNASAMGLPSGVYIYSMRVNDFMQNRKMILLK